VKYADKCFKSLSNLLGASPREKQLKENRCSHGLSKMFRTEKVLCFV
jgi:hypothetical protein